MCWSGIKTLLLCREREFVPWDEKEKGNDTWYWKRTKCVNKMTNYASVWNANIWKEFSYVHFSVWLNQISRSSNMSVLYDYISMVLMQRRIWRWMIDSINKIRTVIRVFRIPQEFNTSQGRYVKNLKMNYDIYSYKERERGRDAFYLNSLETFMMILRKSFGKRWTSCFLISGRNLH